jgi:hypothetical protein
MAKQMEEDKRKRAEELQFVSLWLLSGFGA